MGVKFSTNVLKSVAIELINSTTNSHYNANTIDQRSKEPILSRISNRWIQSFMEKHNIVARKQTGNLMVSPAKQEIIEPEVAFHMGEVSRGFQSGLMKEECVENADETHFLVNMDNGRTLGFRGDEHVKYSDVVSGGEGMTVMVRITGGVNAIVEVPFVIFQNKNRSYPIRGTPDNVPGVCYRTGPKGWMDQVNFNNWISEPRVIQKLPFDKKRVLYVDNCSGHTMTENLDASLKKINTELRYLVPNATHLIQPADSFIIAKLKKIWTRDWEEYKVKMIRDGIFKENCSGEGSGKIPNPGKQYFLQLIARAVRELNNERDKNGLRYARKAMIRCGLALNINGCWERRQLFPHIQEIIKKYEENFNGSPVDYDGVYAKHNRNN